MSSDTVGTTVTRDDLEQRFAAVQQGLQSKMRDRKSSLVTIATVGGVILALVIYFLGKRAGKRKTTLVEIRRV